MGVGPGSAQVRGGLCEQFQQLSIDGTTVVPKITGDVVAEEGSWRESSDLSDELLRREASFFARDGVGVDPGVVALLGVADLTGAAGRRARRPAGGADGDGACLLVM